MTWEPTDEDLKRAREALPMLPDGADRVRAALIAGAGPRIDALEADLERERLRRAACGVAALGYDGERLPPGHLAHSASYDDVRRLRDECEALRRAQAWNPIDTAPRDGSRILLWLPNHAPGRVVVGAWSFDYLEPEFWHPTHWMPLPKGPTP